MERIEDKEGQTAKNNRSNTTARQQTMHETSRNAYNFNNFILNDGKN